MTGVAFMVAVAWPIAPCNPTLKKTQREIPCGGLSEAAPPPSFHAGKLVVEFEPFRPAEYPPLLLTGSAAGRGDCGEAGTPFQEACVPAWRSLGGMAFHADLRLRIA